MNETTQPVTPKVEKTSSILGSLREKAAAEKRRLGLADFASLDAKSQNLIGQEFRKVDLLLKKAQQNVRQNYHDQALFLVSLEKRAEMTGRTISAEFASITGGKPNNHAETMAACYRKLVSTGEMDEQDFLDCQSSYLQKANSVLAKGATIKNVVDILKRRAKDTIAQLKALVKEPEASPEEEDVLDMLTRVHGYLMTAEIEKLGTIYGVIHEMRTQLDEIVGDDLAIRYMDAYEKAKKEMAKKPATETPAPETPKAETPDNAPETESAPNTETENEPDAEMAPA